MNIERDRKKERKRKKEKNLLTYLTRCGKQQRRFNYLDFILVASFGVLHYLSGATPDDG